MRSLLVILGIAAVVAAAAWYLLSGPTGYEHLAQRIGQDRAERIVRGTTPMAIARLCHDSYGEDTALVEAVAEYIVRNQAELRGLADGPDGVNSLSEREEDAVDEEALRRAADVDDSAARCREAAMLISAGTFDL